MNEYIMRCYYNITKNETDIGAYRLLLHLAFLQKYSEWQVTEQRIAQIRQDVARDVPSHQIEVAISQIEQEVNQEDPGPYHLVSGAGHPGKDPEPPLNVNPEIVSDNHPKNYWTFGAKYGQMKLNMKKCNMDNI
ncbi:unnamed protein product [Psylliodes chrysocephalus]|uniref:Uncharacterized protein n=1 Tax=Psylliodes chrysocephalus TaxID=3402493 RepID=A0A9P0CX41_9CUCU|nr:unnamed protein product [Psylliodes chrysocephala]